MNKLITEIAEHALKIGNGASTESMVKYALNKYHDRLIEEADRQLEDAKKKCPLLSMDTRAALSWLKQQR
jgi:hypothetical protein